MRAALLASLLYPLAFSLGSRDGSSSSSSASTRRGGAPFDQHISSDPIDFLRLLRTQPVAPVAGGLTESFAVRGLLRRQASRDSEVAAAGDAAAAAAADDFSSSPRFLRAASGFSPGLLAKVKDMAQGGAQAAADARLAALAPRIGRTSTDVEMCQGCQLSLSRVLEHTNARSSETDIIFSLRSACHNVPPILDEACNALISQDTVVAATLAKRRQVGAACHVAGICTRADLAATRLK